MVFPLLGLIARGSMKHIGCNRFRPVALTFPAFRAEGRLVGSSTSIEELKLAMDLWGHQQAGYVYDQKGANKSLNILASGGCLIFRARD